jgi:hypothetical protein
VAARRLGGGRSLAPAVPQRAGVAGVTNTPRFHCSVATCDGGIDPLGYPVNPSLEARRWHPSA